jgi:hypothetical protein
MFPYRIDTKSKTPIEFEVTIKNQNSIPRLVSYEIIFPEGLAINKGQKKTEIFKLGELRSEESKTFKYRLMPNNYLREGNIEIIVRAYEHFGSYDHLEQTTEKVITIRVI